MHHHVNVHVCSASVPHRHVERVDLDVRGAVDGSIRLVPRDVEQRTVPEVVRPLDLQSRFTDGAGSTVQELRVQ